MSRNGAIEAAGFIGLGAMGGTIARRLLEAGTALTVYDVRAEPVRALVEQGARAAGSLGDLRDCTLVMTCLPGPREFEEILFGADGLARVLRQGSLIVDLTSNDPETVQRAAESLGERGIGLVDAPVAGGKAGAEAGTLAIALGGSPEDVARARPFLEPVSSYLVHAGPAGAGDVCKLVHNMGIHIIRQALAEMFTLGVKAGVDAEKLLEFVRNGSFGRLDQLHSWFRPRVLSGEFLEGEPAFRLQLAVKDIQLAADLATRTNVPLPLGTECLRIAREASAEGLDDRDAWITFHLQERRSGVVVRHPSAANNSGARSA